MNPVSASTMLAMANLASSAAVQGIPFKDFLNISVATADDQMIAPGDAANPGDGAVLNPAAIDSTLKTAIPGALAGTLTWTNPSGASPFGLAQAPLADGTADEQQCIAADTSDFTPSMDGAELAKPNISTTSMVAPPQKAEATKAKDGEPRQEEEAEAALILLEPAPVSPSAVPVPTQASVALAAHIVPATQTRKSSAEFSALPVGIDMQPARPNELANTPPAVAIQKEAHAKTSEPLPPVILENASYQFNLETRLGTNVAPSPIAPVPVPTGPPIAELRQLALNQDREWIGALSRDIVSNAARDNHLQFTLIPENLGQLDVALTNDNGQINVRLETSSAAAAQIISADQARLIEDLRQSGLKLGQFEMSSRHNGNGQHRPPAPERQNTDTLSNPTQPTAYAQTRGRFA